MYHYDDDNDEDDNNDDDCDDNDDNDDVGDFFAVAWASSRTRPRRNRSRRCSRSNQTPETSTILKLSHTDMVLLVCLLFLKLNIFQAMFVCLHVICVHYLKTKTQNLPPFQSGSSIVSLCIICGFGLFVCLLFVFII